MSDEREEEQSKRKFKVVDRRRFDSDGEMREGAKEEAEAEAKAKAAPKAPEPAPAAPAPQAAPPPQAKAPPPDEAPAQNAADADEDEEIAIPFGAFLQSLAQQCVMQLGMMPLPSGQRHLDLEGARDTIDILSMLKVKTKGNLSAEEAEALKQILYELRMTYMEIANKVAAAQAAPPGGKPPGA